MTGKLFMEALTDIDDRFIVAAADTENIKSLFENINDAQLLEEKNKAKRKKSLKKLLIAAIVSILLIAVASFSISGSLFDFNFPKEVIEFFEEHVKIDLRKKPGDAVNYSDESYKVVKELKELGIENVALPTVILEEWTQTKEIFSQHDNDVLTTASFKFEKDSMIASVNISRYSDESYIGQPNITDPDNGEMLTVNGLSVYIFYQGAGTNTVTYVDGLTVYSYTFEWCYYDEVVEIINTIGQ